MRNLIIVVASALLSVPVLAVEPTTDPANSATSPSSSMSTPAAKSSDSKAIMKFERLDSNKDGAIDTSEATAHGLKTDRFKAMDINLDSKLDKDEYVAGSAKGTAHDEPAS